MSVPSERTLLGHPFRRWRLCWCQAAANGGGWAAFCSAWLRPSFRDKGWSVSTAESLARVPGKLPAASTCSAGLWCCEAHSAPLFQKRIRKGQARGGSSPVPGPRCWCSLPGFSWSLPPPPLNFCFPPLFQLAVLEDYADPFDAAQVAGSQAGLEKVTENDGYMEPYEAQKMMAGKVESFAQRPLCSLRLGSLLLCEFGEIRQKGLREAPSRPLHLYDTPYEPVTGGLEADSDRPACPRPRESRLPEDDERPPEEYDQPWEWKKERISKAFAGEPGWRQRAGLRHGTSSLKSTKTLSAEPGPFLGERIDPALPLESQCWYHGAISRTDAETLLRLCKEASYLVRNSETSKNDFSLSLKSSQGFMHMKLSRTQENKYVLGQHSPPFDSVPEIIHHYASRKLPIKGAEHMSLLYPVAIRTL
uniref:Src homology 2 domain containing F n=1 Tax=Anser cygnoides TaxID=8845 RepID=A0A8B9EB43_ANSCY